MDTAGTAVVVGGGIGGLTAAVALRRAGWQVTILERAEQFGEIGAGIVLQSNALHCLDAVGLGQAVRRGGRPDTAGGLRTASGRWLSRIDGAALDQRLGTTAVVLHRAELHRILRSALPTECVLTGATPEAITGDGHGDGVEVHYVHATEADTVRADLVVGADGLNSWVRAHHWPDAPAPVYAGSTAWRAVTRSVFPSDTDMSVSWGDGQEFGSMPLTDGRAYWYAAVTAPQGQHATDELAELRHRFDGWHFPIPALLADTAPEAVLRHDIYRLPPLATYVHGRVALLGDAAHAMTPNLGQGGGQAIEDAVVLAAALSTAADVPTALARFDRERRSRTQAISRASTLMGRFGQQLENPLAIALRNTAIKLTPARVALRSMARFGDWTPPAIQGSDVRA